VKRLVASLVRAHTAAFLFVAIGVQGVLYAFWSLAGLHGAGSLQELAAILRTIAFFAVGTLLVWRQQHDAWTSAVHFATITISSQLLAAFLVIPVAGGLIASRTEYFLLAFGLGILAAVVIVTVGTPLFWVLRRVALPRPRPPLTSAAVAPQSNTTI
jgi:hypothetical protein